MEDRQRLFKCGGCSKETSICYTDSGVLGMVHGHCFCKSCYIADGHTECISCKELLPEQWKYCPHCGWKQSVFLKHKGQHTLGIT